MHIADIYLKKNDVVILKERSITGTISDIGTRTFKIEGGNGCDPKGMGRKIFGRFVGHPSISSEELLVIARSDIERMATEQESARAEGQ